MSVVGSDWWRFSTLSRRISSSSWSDTSQSGGSVSDSTCQSNKTNSTLCDNLSQWNSGIYLAANKITYTTHLSVCLLASDKNNTNLYKFLHDIKSLHDFQISWHAINMPRLNNPLDKIHTIQQRIWTKKKNLFASNES